LDRGRWCAVAWARMLFPAAGGGGLGNGNLAFRLVGVLRKKKKKTAFCFLWMIGDVDVDCFDGVMMLLLCLFGTVDDSSSDGRLERLLRQRDV